MDTRNTNAHSSVPSRNDAKNHSQARTRSNVGGVIHDNVRHTSNFTVVGNHLAQHTELSGLAIGVALYIQSVPSGTSITIEALSVRLREGTKRISNALNELEAHGYLSRKKERLDDGRMVTRTVSHNHPGRSGAEEPTQPKPRPRSKPQPQPRSKPEPQPRSTPQPQPRSTPQPRAKPQSPARRPEPRRKALPAVPQPAYPAPDLLVTALGVLTDLRRDDPRLYLSAADVDHLAPGVVAWLERELTPEAVRRALVFDLPQEPLRRPAALLAHRLNAHLPPLPPFRPADPGVRHPLQNCDTCDRAYRAPDPGTCPACTPKT
ncbi:helix-turn-helix domain-containing protein [Streptomyces sp. NPDC002825]|uniref:helix-turn-helix domain-containing protein n=1 Tax=Streptomyces sp. NPDC002825 TaxID=3154666 RepID=UPI0033210ED9